MRLPGAVALRRLAAAGALVLAATLPGPGANAQAPEPRTIRVVKQPIAALAPFVVAAVKDLDREFGVDIVLEPVASDAQNMAALVDGTVAVSPCTFDAIARLRDIGKDAIAVYNLAGGPIRDLVVGRRVPDATQDMPAPRRLALLRGMRIGYSTPGSPSDSLARMVLAKGAGLDPATDVEMVRVGSIAGMTAALAAGEIDAFMLPPPAAQHAAATGTGRVLIASGDLVAARASSYALCTMVQYVRQNPLVIAGFVKAVQRGNDWVRQNTDESVRLMQAAFPEIAPEAWAAGLPAALPGLSPDGRFEAEAVRIRLAAAMELGLVEKAPDAAEGVLWTNQFLAR